MSPHILPGDRLVTDQQWRRRGLKSGDVAIYRSEDVYLAKRVVGLPGDNIAVVGGVLVVNGLPFPDPWWAAATRPEGEWSVPPDCGFFLGDNRANSGLDSRVLGPIEGRKIHSRVVLRYRPWRRAARFKSTEIRG